MLACNCNLMMQVPEDDAHHAGALATEKATMFGLPKTGAEVFRLT